MRTFAAAVALVVGLAAVGAAVLLVGSNDDDVEIGANVLVNPVGMLTANNSPTLARHPEQSDHLVVAHRIDRPGFSALLEWSADAGATWQPTTLPLPPGTEACTGSIDGQLCPFAPDVAFGSDGTLYVVYVHLEGEGNTPAALWLARSTDGGRTIEAPVRIAGELTFQPRVVVGPEGTVHLTWLDADGVALNQLVGQARIVASRSTDGGQSFSEPVPVSDADRLRVGAASPIIGSDGDLVILYEDFKDNRRDFENLEGPPAEDPFALVLTRSSDGGATFSPGNEFESGIVATRRFLVFLPEYPSLAAGPDGALYAAWSDGRNGDDDVFVRRSGDGGSTWEEPVRVNDNAVDDGTDQYLPRLSVAPGGRVDVLFYDRRRDPSNVLADVFLGTSTDGGRSFTNRRVSSEPFDSRVGPTFGPAYGTDFGTRIGLDSTDDGAYGTWTDTRLGTDATGRQDIFGAPVVGLGSSGIPGWLLIAALTVAAALVAMFVLGGVRRPKGRKLA